jgi:ABC-2 type transport system ATP-binding protein
MVNSSNPLEIQVYQNLSEAVAFLRRHPLINHVSIDGNRIAACFVGGQMEEAYLLRQMIEAGILVGSFHRRQGGLESVFMQITGDREERVVAQG